MRALLFDLDGVLYQGNEAIPGALETIEWVQAKHIPYLFVTNTSSKPRTAICHKLSGMGIKTVKEHILSPPVAAACWLKMNTNDPVALFVPTETRSEFSGIPLWNGDPKQAVGAVVIGDLADDWNFSLMNQAFCCLMQDPRPVLIALGMTRYWKSADGLKLDAGPFVAALQYASGVEPLVTGKPAATFFQTAADTLGVDPHQIMMIGDDIRGDVAGAQQAGMQAALVKTGKFHPNDLDQAIRPDALFNSIQDLPTWYEQRISE